MRWTVKYKRRFLFKFRSLRDEVDQRNIQKYSRLIANHSDPKNIGGCVHCSTGDSVKLQFNTGWAIIYQITGSELIFLNFYKPLDVV